MTTIFQEEKRCFICGQTSQHTGLGSTNRFGPPDLDTRPPEMMRSTIYHWIQCCPTCGYCAPDLAQGSPSAGRVVNSEPYLQQKADLTYPILANHFLCWAMLQEAAADYPSAGWAAVHAAWACDDAGATTAAAASRRRALILFEQAAARGSTIAAEAGVAEAIRADLLRRSGQFEQVELVSQQGLASQPEALVAKILRFQQALARQQDAGCYTVAHVVQSGNT
jgi:hypothetical protein